MRSVAVFMILAVLFVVLVGSRFRASDGERLAAVARKLSAKFRESIPASLNPVAPLDAFRRELPTRPEDAVRSRLTGDKRLEGQEITVTGEAGVITLRGVLPDARTRRIALSLAENTTGVTRVIDELAVPE
jgi:osmotically-inducible protein OsmY